MKISTKGRYTLRLMLDLAINYTGKYISLKEIAKRQNISEKYLEQLISKLNKYGYVKSVRGAQGGYMLAKAPEECVVGDILRIMEGELAPVACLQKDSDKCELFHECVTVDVWAKIQQAVYDVVDNITLADLVNRYHDKCTSPNGGHYSI